MKGQPEWPVAFFDDDYLRIYRPMFTEETTRREVDFIESAVALGPGASVLDLACGIGRHAIGMALRGYRVTGLDFEYRIFVIGFGPRLAPAACGLGARYLIAECRKGP